VTDDASAMSEEKRIEQRLVDESHDSDCPAAGVHFSERGPEDKCECWAEDVNTLLDLLAARDIELRVARAERDNLQRVVNEHGNLPQEAVDFYSLCNKVHADFAAATARAERYYAALRECYRVLPAGDLLGVVTTALSDREAP
jgi:hypothetical protein